MSAPLRTLIVEDRPADADLMLHQLRQAGFAPDWKRVETEEDFLANLGEDLDVILADYSLPQFDALHALHLLRDRGLEIPFIVVTGRASEEVAVECIKQGAADYLLKDRLARLGLAVTQALQSKKLADEKQKAEEEIRRRNRELTLLNRVIAASAASLEPESILERTCRELAQAFDVTQAVAALLSEERISARVVAEYRAVDRDSAIGHTIPVADNPWLRYMLVHKTPLAIDDAQNDPRLSPIHDLMRQRQVVSVLLLPLTMGDEVIGSLSLEAAEKRLFSAEEISLAWSVADQLAGALARARLDKERRQLSAVIDQTAEVVIITDTEGAILYINPAFERITGYIRAEVLGQTPRLLKSDKQGAGFYEEMWATISAGRVWHGRLVNKNKAGTFYTVDATITPVRDESGHIVNYVGVQRDVTQELQLEEEYRQAQRLEAVGRLAGGIAHDFNNLLTALVGYTQLLLEGTSPEDANYQDLSQIQETTDRAATLVRQLLTFSRREPTKPVVLNLNDVITDLLKLLDRIIGEDVQVIARLASDLPQIRADPGQMEQVLMNLAVNARDAMPDGGQLLIETASVDFEEGDGDSYIDMVPGTYVFLTISDSGVGMSQDVLRHIFEPFFTTKPEGEGTGLGLAMVYGIVKQHSGRIHAESESGGGTTFRIYIPAYYPEPGLEQETPAEERTPQIGPLTGSERLLVVEDEAPVRELVHRALEGFGYDVLVAANAKEATDLFRTHQSEIAMLISDVVMPDMPGPALYRSLAAEVPCLKVLFLSGYSTEIVQGRGLLQDVPFLQKPFTLTELARAVRQVLDT
jgi:PAS domain S-box-containing protein